jgi:hypothetical protein
MVEGKSSPDIARKARQTFAEQMADAGPRLLAAVLEAARLLLDKPAERSVAQQRRDTLQSLMTHGEEWIERLGEMLRDACVADRPSTSTGALVASMQGHTQKLMLVDDETVQKEIFISRLSQAIVDQAARNCPNTTCSGRSSSRRSSCAHSSTATSARTPGPESRTR